jgi:hypothetical protein
MRPILYLDVEGTLLLLGAGRAMFRPHLEEFLDFIRSGLDRMDCYWLTSYTQAQIERLFGLARIRIEGIRYRSWAGSKAEALDRAAPGFWVDDRLTDHDQVVLASHLGEGRSILYRPILRWDGDPRDSELIPLRAEIGRWLGLQVPERPIERCELVA